MSTSSLCVGVIGRYPHYFLSLKLLLVLLASLAGRVFLRLARAKKATAGRCLFLQMAEKRSTGQWRSATGYGRSVVREAHDVFNGP